MSKELVEILKTMDSDSLPVQLAIQCSPFITGLKIASLYIIPSKSIFHIHSMFKKRGISVYVLYQNSEKAILLLYKQKALWQYLNLIHIRKMLQEIGYDISNLEKALSTLSERYQYSMESKGAFPHEIGVFLGYPLKDVNAFIKYKGKNFLYSSYWKVYSNLPKALDLFQKYDRSREKLIDMLSKGISMEHILDIYHWEKDDEEVI